MASQRITIAKIGGEAGVAITSRFRRWAELRVFDDPMEWDSAQWPIEARREIDAFASTLRAHGHELPVFYFSEYVDFWSMEDVYSRWLSQPDRPRAIEVHCDRFQLWCYALPDGGSLADLLQRAPRLKRIRERDSQEERWFTIQLLEAILAWSPMVEVAAVVVLREVFGGLVEDHEVDESLTIVPDWIASPCLELDK
jgi:hypothetical protein